MNNQLTKDDLPGQQKQLTTALWPIAVARMLIGILWLYALRWKLPPSFDGRGETSLREWLELAVEHAAVAPYGELIESLVIPNFAVFAWLVFVAELLTGLSLLTGTLTRAGAALGLALSLNLGIAMLDVPGEWPWSYVMMAMWHLLFVLSAPGQKWGVDAWLTGNGTPSSTVRLLTSTPKD